MAAVASWLASEHHENKNLTARVDRYLDRFLGGQIIATAPRSQTMTGTVREWEGWTGMVFPSTGEYVIPRGLSTLHIDRDEDRGRYVEPNVWVRHR